MLSHVITAYKNVTGKNGPNGADAVKTVARGLGRDLAGCVVRKKIVLKSV